jgi:DmX-like protein
VPSLVTADPDQEPNFILHWLNNKEMHFTLQAENLLHVNISMDVVRFETDVLFFSQELTKKAVEKEDNYEQHDNPSYVDDENGTPAKNSKTKLVKGVSQDESNSEDISQGHHHASTHSGGIASHTMR